MPATAVGREFVESRVADLLAQVDDLAGELLEERIGATALRQVSRARVELVALLGAVRRAEVEPSPVVAPELTLC